MERAGAGWRGFEDAVLILGVSKTTLAMIPKDARHRRRVERNGPHNPPGQAVERDAGFEGSEASDLKKVFPRRDREDAPEQHAAGETGSHTEAT